MDADSAGAFKAELDRLKSKYRKEALRAVAAASSEAYERGKQEARESCEREVGRWKAVAEAVQSNDMGHSKPVLLVQHVVEQVYRDIKLEFSDSKELSINKVKSTLLSSTHKLMADMPEVVLAAATKRVAEDKKEAAAPNPLGWSEQAYNGAHVSASLPRPRTQQVRYLLHSCDSLPKHYVSVLIGDVSGNVVKGIFVDGQFVTYNIATWVESLSDNARHLRCHRIEKRASDVKALRQVLAKELPRAPIPPVPNRNYKIEALVRSPKRPKKPEQKVQYRRRMYAVWLQYVSNLPDVQASPTLAQFLVGDLSLDGGALPTEHAEESQPRVGALSETALFAALFEDALRGRRHCRTTEGAERAEAAAFLADKLVAADSGAPAAWGRNYLHSNPYLAAQPEVEPSEERSHRQIFAMQSAALRDLRTVDRDMTQLRTAGAGAVAACRALVDCCCGFNAEMGDLLGALSAWQQLEPPDSLEHAALDAVSSRTAESNTAAECIGEGLQCALLEPTEFLYGDCVDTAREGLDAVLRAFPPASFVSDQPYYSTRISAEEGSGHSNKSVSAGLSSLQHAQEGVAAAVAIARGWDSSRHVRGAMLLQTVLRSASSLSLQHGRARVVWEAARATLAQINVATDGGEEFERAASHVSNSDHMLPALQGAISSLKLAIQSELGGFTKPREEERSSFVGRCSEGAVKAPEQVAGIAQLNNEPHDSGGSSSRVVKPAGPAQKGLTALKSFKAVISRAMMPAGKRRSPSICRSAPPSLPREEDVIAAMYNQQHAAPESSTSTSKTGASGTDSRPQAGESDSLLQQDQRQARLAARRQATAQAGGGGHVSSKIKTSSGVQAVAQAPDADAFSAAPRPAAAVASHAVYTTPTELPSAAPVAARSNGAASSPVNLVPESPTVSRSKKESSQSRLEAVAQTLAPDLRSAQSAPQPVQPAATPRKVKTPVASSEQPPAAAVVADVAPVPSGWVEVEAEGGGVYYYHSVTRVARWDRPNEEVAAALEARIQQANAQVDDAVQKHKEERLREQERQSERDAQIDQLRVQVKDRVDKWAYGRALGLVAPKVLSGASAAAPATRDLALLLCSLHTLIPYIPGPDAVLNAASLPQPPSAATCAPSEIKKAYMRAVRFVHPDKLPDDASVETQLVAEAVFIILTDAFNRFRAGSDNS